MFGSKLFASLLVTTTSTATLAFKKQQMAQCAEKQPSAGAQQGAEDLDKILSSAMAEGGIPPDPEEIQELLAKAQGRTIRRPPPFQRLVMPLKMMTMCPPADGIQFDIMLPLSPRFNLGGSWVFSNTKPNRFELQCALSSMSANNPMNQDEVSFISTRSDPSGKLEFSGQYSLMKDLSLRAEGFFMDSDINKSHLQYELMKEFNDSHISYKFGSGSHNISWMQTISPSLIAGFEMFYVPMQREVAFCYGATYAKDIHQYFFQYHPLARKETLTVGYVARPSKRLTLFTELKGSGEGFSDTTAGFRVRFLEGMLTGSFSSSLKFCSVYKHILEGLFTMQFTTQLDFQKPEKPANFGVSVSLGGM